MRTETLIPRTHGEKKQAGIKGICPPNTREPETGDLWSKLAGELANSGSSEYPASINTVERNQKDTQHQLWASTCVHTITHMHTNGNTYNMHTTVREKNLRHIFRSYRKFYMK